MLCEYNCGNIGKYQLKNGKWCCEKSRNSCPHERRKNSKSTKNKSKIKPILLDDSKIYICDYGCGRISKYHFEKSNKYCCSSHYRKCDFYREQCRQNMLKENNHMYGKKHTNKTKRKMKKALTGRQHTKQTKRLMRKKAIERIIKHKGQVSPNYNPNACSIIDEYGLNNGYTFQHAENGGEYYIKQLGYWVDGYDPDKNVVIEIDEGHHFDSNGNLIKKDIERQKEIQQYLNCNFIRIKI